MSETRWQVLRDRLEQARNALERSLEAQADEPAVLRARAVELARQHAADPAPSRALEILAFRAGSDRFAFDAGCVRSVQPLRSLGALPGAPPFIRGIAHLHGLMVAVVDLRRFFGLADHALTDLRHLIVLENSDAACAVLADAVDGMRSVAEHEIAPSVPASVGVVGQYARAVLDGGAVLLDGEKLFSDPRMCMDKD